MNVWTIFEEAVARHAASTAVFDGDQELSYAELDGRVRTLALRLAKEGVGPGDRVAILAHNSSHFLACYFAAGGLGAVLQPLNHRLAADEIAFSLRDARTKLFCAGRAFAPLAEAVLVKQPDVRISWLDGAPTDQRPADFEPTPAAAEELAQLYYTSGTTGRPKGVMLTHRNVCAHAQSCVAELGLAGGDRWGHVAPMFHLADAWACFAITLVGGVHVMAPRFDADEVLRLIERRGITITNLVPTMLNLMVKSPLAGELDLSSMRRVLSGGASIAPALVRRASEVFGCEYVQTYGMTETSPFLTLGLLNERLLALPEDDVWRYRARTGRAFRGIELEVVDEAGRPVPRDDQTVGEIRVKGETVSPGYWERPEETRAAFRDGWLYTGDLAVVETEGYVNIVDRKKDMIITGGENVYSTEVENVLYEHPAILEAAVFGREDERWGEIVCAAVVLRPGHAAGAEELQDFCRERIATYKTPRQLDFLEELPKTGSGKIAKRLLRDR